MELMRFLRLILTANGELSRDPRLHSSHLFLPLCVFSPLSSSLLEVLPLLTTMLSYPYIRLSLAPLLPLTLDIRHPLYPRTGFRLVDKFEPPVARTSHGLAVVPVRKYVDFSCPSMPTLSYPCHPFY